MYVTKYQEYKEKLEKDVPDLLFGTQKALNESKSKGEDFVVLSHFMTDLLNRQSGDPEYRELFTDDQAILPMPESVMKQMTGMLFGIHNLDPLFDLDISQGFVYITPGTNDKEIVDYYNQEIAHTINEKEERLAAEEPADGEFVRTLFD